MLISRDEKKLAEQAEEISAKFEVDCKYLVNDFKNIPASQQFYARLKEVGCMDRICMRWKSCGLADMIAFCGIYERRS